MRTYAWAALGVIGALSATCILANYVLMLNQVFAKPGKKVPSLIPFVGGILGLAAAKVYFTLKFGPRNSWLAYGLLAAALDPGCYLVYFLVMPLARRLRPKS